MITGVRRRRYPKIPMETALIASVVNFGLVVGTLVFAGRKPLAQFLSNRSDTIQVAIAEAEKMARESRSEYDRWETLLANSRVESESFKRDAAALIETQRARSVADAHKEAERIENEVGLVTKTEYGRARGLLEAEICNGSAALAKAYLSENIRGELASQLFVDTLERVTHAG